MKRIKVLFVVLALLVILASSLAFVGCKSKESTVVNTAPFKGVIVYFYNEVVTTQEIADSDAITSLLFTYDEAKNADEGLFTLLDLKEAPYNQRYGINEKIGTVELNDTDRSEGNRIFIFTSKESDKSTTDTARTINYKGHVLTQIGVDVEDMTFEEGTYIFVAKFDTTV